MPPSTRRWSELGLTDQRRRAGRLAERRPAQALEHGHRAADSATHLLPRRAHVRARPEHGPAHDAAPPRARGRRDDRRADHACDLEHPPVRQDRCPRPRRALAFVACPTVLRYFDADEFDEIYDRLADELSCRVGRAISRHARSRRHRGRTDRAATEGRGHALSGWQAVARNCSRAAPVPGPEPPELRPLRALPGQLRPARMQPAVITLLLLALFPSNLFVDGSENPTVPLQLVYTLASSSSSSACSSRSRRSSRSARSSAASGW